MVVTEREPMAELAELWRDVVDTYTKLMGTVVPGMDDDDELIVWQQYYRVGAPRRFARDGYTLSMRELTLRDAPPTALPPP